MACAAICTDSTWLDVITLYDDMSFSSDLVTACDQFDPLASHAPGDGAAFELFGQIISAILVLHHRYPVGTCLTCFRLANVRIDSSTGGNIEQTGFDCCLATLLDANLSTLPSRTNGKDDDGRLDSRFVERRHL